MYIFTYLQKKVNGEHWSVEMRNLLFMNFRPTWEIY